MDRRLLLGLIAALAVPAPAATAAAKAEKKFTGGESYVPIQTVLGTAPRADGRRGVLSVECGLQIADETLRSRAVASMPRLRSAYRAVVQTYAAGLPYGAAPNVDYIGRALQQQTDQVLGRRGAKVLLGAVVVN